MYSGGMFITEREANLQGYIHIDIEGCSMCIVGTQGPVYLIVYNIHLHLVCLFSTAVSLHNLQAFMYTDKHGEVCPAGWQPGADTIIPDPKVSSQSCSQLVLC